MQGHERNPIVLSQYAGGQVSWCLPSRCCLVCLRTCWLLSEDFHPSSFQCYGRWCWPFRSSLQDEKEDQCLMMIPCLLSFSLRSTFQSVSLDVPVFVLPGHAFGCTWHLWTLLRWGRGTRTKNMLPWSSRWNSNR